MMKELTLTQIMEQYPETVAIMDRYSIDHQEGSMDTLEEAAMILGLSVDTIDEEFITATHC